MENSTETADNSNESFWKNFKTIFPYLSVFIIILGLIYEGIFYNHFNIDIQDYIGVSELLLEISKVAVYVIILTLVFFYFSWYYQSGQTGNFTREAAFSSIVAIIVLLLVDIMFFIFPLLILIIYFLFYLIITGLITILFKKFTGKYLNQNTIAILITIVVLMIGLTAVKALVQANNVEKGEYIGTKIYTKDSTYVSDSTHFYIGKTTSFYFIFNKDRKSATIIPERKVNRFELKETTILLH